MALFGNVTATQVGQRANRDFSDFGLQSQDELLAFMQRELDAMRQIANAVADAASSEFDFPFTAENIRRARPGYNAAQIEETLSQQVSLYEKAILDGAAGNSYGSLLRQNEQQGNRDQQQGQVLRDNAAKLLEAARAWTLAFAEDIRKGGGDNVPTPELTTISARLTRANCFDGGSEYGAVRRRTRYGYYG